MKEFVELNFEGKTYKFPLIVGTEGEKAIDISSLRQQTGLITLDTGYANTGSCESAITLNIPVLSKRLFF
jgi:citrate synthase